MNIAILVGISEYNDEDLNLPGCTGDITLMHTLLKETGRFDVIEIISPTATAARLKKRIVDIVSANKTTEGVGELFFYYTGHGDVNNTDFYFIPSDYDEKRYNTTTLSNTELDELLKNMTPKITVKVIDACHSAVTYVKDANTLQKIIEPSGKRFDKCYFMFSSQAAESSWQTSRYSDFTKIFVESVIEHGEESVRYKDVIDAISDRFAAKGSQTPRFVTQADFIEPFCDLTSELRVKVRALLIQGDAGDNLDPDVVVGSDAVVEVVHKMTMVDRVLSEAQQYCSEAEAIEQLESLKPVVEKRERDATVGALYDEHVEFQTTLSLPQAVDIAKSFEDGKHGFFVKATHSYEEYEDYVKVPRAVSRYSQLMGLGAEPEWEFKLVERQRPVLSGFAHTAKMPYQQIMVVAKPRHENLQMVRAYIVPVLSKATVRVFYSFQRLRDIGWSDRAASDRVSWKAVDAPLKGMALRAAVLEVLKAFDDATLQPLYARFGSDEENGNEGGEGATGGATGTT